jgi:hypothetical protein
MDQHAGNYEAPGERGEFVPGNIQIFIKPAYLQINLEAKSGPGGQNLLDLK